MAFTVPESKRSLHQNQFEFQVPGDDTIHRVPKLKHFPLSQIEKLSKGGAGVTIADLLDMFAEGGTGAVDAVRTLDTEQLQELTKAWQRDSGLTVGESSASTDS